MAPTKALCSERAQDWQSRLETVGCPVVELTVSDSRCLSQLVCGLINFILHLISGGQPLLGAGRSIQGQDCCDDSGLSGHGGLPELL